jgi:hypothetical protein
VGELTPIPRLGDVFEDVRDNGRTMRISCHADRGAVVVSLWHDTLCRGSFRLAADDLDRFMSALTEMSMSLRLTPTTTERAEGSSPKGPGLDRVAATGEAPEQGEPPCEQTEDVTGPVGFGRVLPMPVPRVA